MKFVKITYVSLFLWAIFTMGCNPNKERLFPIYAGVNPILAPYVNEWLSLAKKHNIKFNNKVTVGLMNINRGNIIGLTWYGSYFREIDIDKVYWEKSTEINKKIALFHELGHAYCDRDHDYDEDKNYLTKGGTSKDYPNGEGFFSDGCPKSIMFPKIVPGICSLNHYDHYINEIFERCEPY